MGNGVSVDQGNLPSYGRRDVRQSADRKQHDWSKLADTPIIEQPSTLSADRKPYSGASPWGQNQKSLNSMENNEQMGTTYSVARTEVDTGSDAYSGALPWDAESSEFAEVDAYIDDYRNFSRWDLKLLENDKKLDVDGVADNTEESADDIDTQLDAYSDALSSVMKDDSGYITRLPTWESIEQANNSQLRQRKKQLGSSSSEDGEVRAAVNQRRERGEELMTSTETALPKSTCVVVTMLR